MGCGTSREVGPDPSEITRRPVTTQAPHATNIGVASQSTVSQTPLIQNAHHDHIPATSRATLNPNSTTSLPSTSAISTHSPSTNRHRHRGATDATASDLSEHYNVPLQLPRPWKSQSRTWTLSQLRRERQDFFDTRVTGQKEVWAALRQIAECILERDVSTGQGIADAVNVTLPTGHLEDGCYDERGNLYKIPEEILSNPVDLQSDEAEVDGATVVGTPSDTKPILSAAALVEPTTNTSPKIITEKQGGPFTNKGKDIVPEDAIQLKCRMSDRGSDVNTYITRGENVSALAVRIKSLAQVPSFARLEMFYLGKKLDQKRPIIDQDYVESHVLNVFVVGAPK